MSNKNSRPKPLKSFTIPVIFALFAALIYIRNAPYCVTGEVRELFNQEKFKDIKFSDVLEVLARNHYLFDDYDGGTTTVFICRGSIRAWDATSIVVKHYNDNIIEMQLTGAKLIVKNRE